jgi:hypothetical protein
MTCCILSLRGATRRRGNPLKTTQIHNQIQSNLLYRVKHNGLIAQNQHIISDFEIFKIIDQTHTKQRNI